MPSLPLWHRSLGDAHLRNPRRKAFLEQLNPWRNAIAHNAFAAERLSGPVSVGCAPLAQGL
jgi:hypothetical protein